MKPRVTQNQQTHPRPLPMREGSRKSFMSDEAIKTDSRTACPPPYREGPGEGLLGMPNLLGMALCLLGALIYLLFRPRVLLGFRLLDVLRMGTLADRWREAVSGWQLPDFVVYCLPGGLWATAWVLIANGIFHDRPRRTRLLWAAVIPAVGAVSELMQGMGLLPGTFDEMDLLCYAVPYVAACCLMKK